MTLPAADDRPAADRTALQPQRHGLDEQPEDDQRPAARAHTAKSASPASLPHVEQRVTLLTLGVSDFARSKAFYASLGWAPALEVEETAFFQANGVILTLWAREKLSPDMGVPDEGARWSGIALAHNVRSRDEVHEIIARARANGAEITREPSETFYGGYAGVFRDPDGHVWEIAHNPGFGLDDDGNVVLPDG